jgi:hypothetical protein
VGVVSNVICSIQLSTAAAFGSEVKLICALFQAGGECMVLPTLKDEEANGLFPKGFAVINLPSGKPYLRITPQP